MFILFFLIIVKKCGFLLIFLNCLMKALSTFFSLSLGLSYCFSLILCPTFSLPLSISPIYTYISHTLLLSLPLSTSLTLSLSVSLSISLSISLSFSLSFYLSLSLSLSLCLSYSLSYSLCPYLIHPFRLDLELSIPRSWLIKYNLESSVNYVREERGRWSTPRNTT